MSDPAIDQLASRGRLRFSEFQEFALYDPQFGFYENSGGAGRGRDFLTSPELGTVFAEVLASAIDLWWRSARAPAEFFFVEVGAGRGKLAHDILQTNLECRTALRYVTVERSARQRAEQQSILPAAVDMRSDLPDCLGAFGVVFANELLDNLPVDLVSGDGEDMYVEARDGDVQWADTSMLEGCVPDQGSARQWLHDALRVLSEGRVVTIDYTRSSDEMRRLPVDSWLRAYREHGRESNVLATPGQCDITCDVAVDQLSSVLPPASVYSQAEFLAKHGILETAEQARREWERTSHEGGLAAVKAKSQLIEITALTDSTGLGGFSVLEWEASGREETGR